MCSVTSARSRVPRDFACAFPPSSKLSTAAVRCAQRSCKPLSATSPSRSPRFSRPSPAVTVQHHSRRRFRVSVCVPSDPETSTTSARNSLRKSPVRAFQPRRSLRRVASGLLRVHQAPVPAATPIARSPPHPCSWSRSKVRSPCLRSPLLPVSPVRRRLRPSSFFFVCPPRRQVHSPTPHRHRLPPLTSRITHSQRWPSALVSTPESLQARSRESVCPQATRTRHVTATPQQELRSSSSQSVSNREQG
jgi:hypothetical protein